MSSDVQVLKRVSLNKTLEFPFWGGYIFVDLHQEVENKEKTYHPNHVK